MNRNLASSTALGLLLAAGVLPAAAAAQEAQTASPPAAAATPAPPPAATAPASAPTAAPTPTFAPRSEVVQSVPPVPQVAEPAAPDAQATAPAQTARAARTPAPAPVRTTARATPARAAAAPAAVPAAAAPVTPTPAPTVAPAAETVAPVSPPAAAPADTPAPAPAAKSSDMSSGSAWAFLGGTLLVILGLIGFLVFRRRNRTEAVDEPYYETVEETPVAVEPAVYAEEPLAAAPLAYEEERVPQAAQVEEPAPAAVADAGGRPWIDIGLRPIRAGTTEDGASVEVELTLANSGDTPAHDVRVSTWMLASPQGTENEAALIDARTNAQVTDVDLEPGADTRVDSALQLPGEHLNGAFRPLVVAEARYPLPDGGEGRIAATFEIGVGGNIDARLHEVLERS